MIQLNPLVIALVSNHLWHICQAIDTRQDIDNKVNQHGIIPIVHTIPGNPVVRSLNNGPIPVSGFEANMIPIRDPGSASFRVPTMIHQGIRPVVKAEAPPPPPPSSGKHNFENISPGLAPDDKCRNDCKMNEGMTFVYCYQDCTHNPNWLLVPEDVESASLPTNLIQPKNTKVPNGSEANNSTATASSTTSSVSKRTRSAYPSDRTHMIFPLDNEANVITLHSSYSIFILTAILLL